MYKYTNPLPYSWFSNFVEQKEEGKKGGKKEE